MTNALRCLDCRGITPVDSKDSRWVKRLAAKGKAQLRCAHCHDLTYQQLLNIEPYQQPSLDDIARAEGRDA